MRQAMSAIGYAIVVVILVGVGMIISAPMMVDNYQKDTKTPKGDLNSRMYDLEMRVNNLENANSDKYVCQKRNDDYDSDRFIFVCEYR